jgi:hypothetical protein
MNEANRNAGKSDFNYTALGIDLEEIGKGTDWLEEMFVDNAKTQNHVLSASGGTDNSNYAMSLSYTDQDGIIGGEDISSYKRYSFRINTEHRINKYVSIGEHFTYSHTNKKGIGVGGLYDNGLHGALNTSPFLPMYDDEGEWFNSNAKDENGQTIYKWSNSETNPVASMNLSNQKVDLQNYMIGDIFTTIEPIKGLRLRSSLGLNFNNGSNHKFLPEYTLSSVSTNPEAYVEQSSWGGFTWKWENTLTYDFNISTHSISALAGMSSEKSQGASQYGKNAGLIFNDFEHAWLDNAKNVENTSALCASDF